MTTNSATSIPLPEYGEWWSTPPVDRSTGATLENIRESPAAQHMAHDEPREDCPGCAAAIYLPAIREAWHSGDNELGELIYSLQDGYGEIGFIPSQGYDWSGIRDSSPAAIVRIYRAINER